MNTFNRESIAPASFSDVDASELRKIEGGSWALAALAVAAAFTVGMCVGTKLPPAGTSGGAGESEPET